MSYAITEFESTPNPNAVKVHVSPALPASVQSPRSFRDAAAASTDPIASAIFGAARPGEITSVLLAGDWLTVNKSPDADWKRIKAGVRSALAAADEANRAPRP